MKTASAKSSACRGKPKPPQRCNTSDSPRASIATAIFYCLATLALAYPLSVHPSATVMSPGVDTDLFVWTLAWDAHAILHQPLHLFDANTFYPFHNSLAFSENLLGSSLFAAPVLWAGGGAVLAMNVVALASIPLSAFGAYWLARELGASRPAAMVAGVVFGFAPPRFFRIDQIHLTTIQWIPFGLRFVHAYVRTERRRDLRFAIAFFSLQALTSGHGAVLMGVALALFAASALASGSAPKVWRCVRDAGLPGALMLLPALMILWPYRRAQDEMSLVRTLSDYRIVPWESFLASPSHVHRWIVDRFLADARIIDRAGAYLFPGVVPLLLALAALVPGVRRVRAKPGSRAIQAAVVILECAAVLACACAVIASVDGPFRWRIGDVVLVSVRSAWRATAIAVLLVVARGTLHRWVPIAPVERAHQALARLRTARRALSSAPATYYTLLTAIAVWLSVPPPIGLWRYVYWLPGFDFIRAPSRFMILAVLGLAVLAAIGFDRIASRWQTAGRRVAAGAAIALILAESSAAPLQVASAKLPAAEIDRWLADRPSITAIAEAPVEYAVSERDRQQSVYMLHSMAHWHPTVHGYSGIHPPLTEGLYEHLTGFPETETIRALESVGVTTVVVHMDAYPPDVRPRIDERLANQPLLRLEHAAGDGRVYSLVPATESP